jgi:hypothetical protein
MMYHEQHHWNVSVLQRVHISVLSAFLCLEIMRDKSENSWNWTSGPSFQKLPKYAPENLNFCVKPSFVPMKSVFFIVII